MLAFLRIATNPRAMARPLTGEEACAIAARWLQHPNVLVVEATERYWAILSGLIVEAQVTGPLATDAALAALALEHGAVLCSTDRDFRRFRDLKLLDPTAWAS